MNRGLSLYLDAVRFLAAVTVVLAHLADRRFGGLFPPLESYGNEAVMVFFVLSGFVIAYVVDQRETSAGTYAISRAARLLSVVLPALLLTAALDAAGTLLRPEAYSPSWGYDGASLAEQYLRAVTFTNGVWAPVGGPGSNIPFWSLGCEVPYYALFGAAAFTSPRLRVPAVLAGLVAAGPYVAMLMPMWLLGVGCYHACQRMALRRAWCALLASVPVLLWAGHEVLFWRFGLPRQHWCIALLFAVHLLGMHGLGDQLHSALSRTAPAIRWLSGATFSIYLYHMPIMQFLVAATPWEMSSWQSRVLMATVPLAAAIGLAEVTERRKAWWQEAIRGLVLTLRLAPRA